MKKLLPALACTLLLIGLMLLQPAQALAQGEPIDTVRVLEQPGSRPFECCFTFIVTNRHPSDVTISDFRVRIISGNEDGRFLPGQGGSPIDWGIFQSTREVQWLSQTFQAEIDSGESLTSFRACVRDTGIYRMVWETRGLNGLLSRDTLVFFCSARDNCDEAFFKPLPSGSRCGFDIDLLNENGDQKIINDFHLALRTPDYTFDTVGSRIPPGWRLDRLTDSTISWRTTNSPLSFGEFVENFRIFINSGSSPFVEMAWWTTSFGDQVCRDSLFLLCGLTEPDTLFMGNTSVGGDTCCRDLLLINTHVPRSSLKSFWIAGGAPNVHLTPPTSLPDGWSASMNQAGDTIRLTIDSLLAPGDSVIFSGICFENDLASGDSARFLWRTEFDGLHVTEGFGIVPCFRDVVFCDSVSAIVDSSLVSEDRCITLNIANRNSRGDQITRVTARISNPGKPHRILRARAPAGWSIDRVTPDSVIFHRGTIDPGITEGGFEFCVDIDTNALDPLTITWTTWANSLRAICTDQIQVRADARRDCDSVIISENGESVDPFCCYNVTFHNRNERGFPITRMELRMPRIDLIFDGASVGNAGGTWRVGTDIFPSVSVDYVGDTLDFGDSVTFRFCVNATAIAERPASFRVVWTTFSEGGLVCFDSILVVCHGSAGLCDTIEPTRNPVPDGGCIAYYRVKNTHTPPGPINNVQITIVDGEASFVSGEAIGTAAGFSQVTLSPKTIIFRGSVIQPGESVEEFHVNFDASQDMNVVLEVCTFEDDQELCCTLDTVECTFLGVEEEEGISPLSHIVKPNPFGDRTEFHYEMSRPGDVTLLLMNEEGRAVRHYNYGMREAGWNTFVLQADDLASGVYIYVLQAGEERGRGRIIVVK